MHMTETLLSDKNPLLKQVRRAVARGSLTEDGYAVAESFHLLEEALASDCEIRSGDRRRVGEEHGFDAHSGIETDAGGGGSRCDFSPNWPRPRRRKA